MTKEQLEQATLQIVIANFQDPNTTPSFDNYNIEDITDAVRLAVTVGNVCDDYVCGKFS
jgi:hypothetical protein